MVSMLEALNNDSTVGTFSWNFRVIQGRYPEIGESGREMLCQAQQWFYATQFTWVVKTSR